VIGVDQPVPVLGGGLIPYVNLDNAASTPAVRAVVDAIEELLPLYASVHRGTGYKSRWSTEVYEQARAIVGEFVGADPERDVVVFGRNTTDAVNLLAGSLPLPDDAVVLTTVLEHHSNDLPWRARARVVHVGARPDGTLDEDQLDDLLALHAGRVALLAVTGASNVTGVVPPVHRLARKVHAAGARIFVDAAQLAAHRRIEMGAHGDPGHLDFVVLSAHKMYAPFGTGALIGARDAFGSTPDHPGGGTVRAVAIDDVVWADLPDREEAGSPNVVGVVALAAAIRWLSDVGLDRIAAHEAELTRSAMARLARVPGLRIHGPVGADVTASKVGVIPFTVEGIDHGLVAAVLGYEHAVGVRSGCFCAHPYVARLLQLEQAEVSRWMARVRGSNKRQSPGMVRMSLGCYSDESDVDRVIGGLEALVTGDRRGTYDEGDDGSFTPRDYDEPLLFSLGGAPVGRRHSAPVG
jgi:selenocysteine lyase/cysteine desulfurase